MTEDLIIENVFLKNRYEDFSTVTVKYRIKDMADKAANYVVVSKKATILADGTFMPYVVIPKGIFVPQQEYVIRIVSNENKKDFVEQDFVIKQ